MSNIKVCARARPPLQGEDKNFALEVESGSEASIRIKRDGEPKCFFSRVWGVNSTQEEIFDAVGAPAVNDVLEGFNATIFVYGQTGTGKTFTLGCTKSGLEGIQPRAINALFKKKEALQGVKDITLTVEYIQLYRDAILDLLDVTKDKLNIRTSPEGEPTIEGNTITTVDTAAQFHNLVKQGDKNRTTANTRLNSSSSRSHSCLITTVCCKPKDGTPPVRGRLYLIDLAGSERVSKSGATGEAYKEAVSINKSLTVLGTCVYGLVNGEKHIPYRDSKLTRMLQHCLSGNGRTTVVITIHPAAEHASETSCTLKFGERAMKVQAQMTIGDYRDKSDNIKIKLSRQQEAYTSQIANLTAYQKLLAATQERCQGLKRQIDDSETQISVEVDTMRDKLQKEHQTTLETYELQLRAQEAKVKKEIESLREANKNKLASAEQRQKEEQELIAAATESFKLDQDERLETVRRKGEEIRSQAAVEEPDEERIKTELESCRKEVADLKFKIRDCTPSKYAGLSIAQLRSKAAKLRGQRVSLSGKVRDLTYVRDDQMQTSALRAAGLSDGESDMSATASSDSSARQAPSVSSESSSLLGDDDSSSSSSSSSDSDGSNGKKGVTFDADNEKNARSLQNPFVDDRKEEEELFRTIEARHLKEAIRKEAALQELIEQILQYLEYGCHVWRVTPTEVQKQFIYLERARSLLFVCKLDADGKTPLRREFTEIVTFKDIKDVMLGQYSDDFVKHVGTEPPPTRDTPKGTTEPEVTTETLKQFFYKSMSIKVRKSKYLDIVACTETDFEAWVVALHRITTIDPQWGKPLDIAHCEGYDALTPEERELCSENHLTPKRLQVAKESLLTKDRLYATLYDLRTLSDCDLLHSQKIFTFFTKQGWVEKHVAWMLKGQKSSMLQPGAHLS
eukprot:TRINITY_DN10437_c0_g1_i1.p1 TRINITY_DN10437_c0_g1~~TRINITY_DN10437_c0_g1_i1.p1  ORF type:complete len:908 (+),score=263.13 TRINITY_DN10437_c0_g1_i1:96-2819(+)